MFDKFIWNEFKHTECGPKGGGQDARNNPSFSAIYIDVASINLDNASLAAYATIYAPVAQLDRVLGYEPSGRRFESFQARHTIKKPHPFLVGLFYCSLFWKHWFVTRFEKIVRNDFSRPTGARRAAYMDVGCNPSKTTIPMPII